MQNINILIDKLPETITICAEEYPIRTDFRIWIRFSIILAGNENIGKKMVDIIKLVFDKLPQNFNEALKQMMWFYNPPKKVTAESKKELKQRVYDFEYDADKIYAAFMQQYGIDLTTANMHWWKFRAYFDNLGEDTRFMQTIKYRNIDLSKIKDNEQRKFYSEMQRLHALPDTRTDEQKEQAFVQALSGLF